MWIDDEPRAESTTSDRADVETPDVKQVEPAEEQAGWKTVADEREQQLLRLRADFDNFRRRTEREREEIRGLVAEEIFGRLLAVHDNLMRALQSLPSTEEAAAWRTGIAMTQKSFLDVLKSQGVEPVETVGAAFDPAVHEAIMRTPADEPEGTVVEELQAGFRWRQRLLRAALVRVSAGPIAATEASPEESTVESDTEA